MELLDKIRSRKARTGVIGLGYVGLPLAVEFAHAGFRAVGIDVDQRKIDAINAGQSYIVDTAAEEVASLVAPQLLERKVRDVMTPGVIAVGPEDTIQAAARTMVQHAIHRVLVMRNGRLEGILTTTDVLRAVANGSVRLVDVGSTASAAR